MATQRTPSARTYNLLYAYGEVCGAIDMTTRVIDLAAAVAASLEPNERAMTSAARERFATATDLAEAICQATGLDYRSSYRVVGRAVADAMEKGLGSGAVDAASIARAAEEVLGEPLEVAPEVITDALDPAAAIVSRTATGGAAPEPMKEMIEDCRQRAGDMAEWSTGRREATTNAEQLLIECVKRLLGR